MKMPWEKLFLVCARSTATVLTKISKRPFSSLVNQQKREILWVNLVWDFATQLEKE